MWILIAAGVVGLIVLAAVCVPLLGRLQNLEHAMRKVQRRQAEAMELQAGAAQLEQTILGLQQRAETMNERIALIKAGHGDETGKHAFRVR